MKLRYILLIVIISLLLSACLKNSTSGEVVTLDDTINYVTLRDGTRLYTIEVTDSLFSRLSVGQVYQFTATGMNYRIFNKAVVK